jgi:hypothetical protein
VGSAQGVDCLGRRPCVRGGVGLVEPGDCGEPHVTDSFAGDGSLREGGRVAAPQAGDHRLGEGDVRLPGQAAGDGISTGHVNPATEIDQDCVDVDGLLVGELVQASFHGADDQTGGEARHDRGAVFGFGLSALDAMSIRLSHCFAARCTSTSAASMIAWLNGSEG